MEKLYYGHSIIEKDSRTLCIFGDKPFWIAGDRSLPLLIEYFNGKISYDGLRTSLMEFHSYSENEVDVVIGELRSIFTAADLFNPPDNADLNLDNIIDNPPNPVINVTRRCNLKCAHCYADANNGQDIGCELTTDELKHTILKILKWSASKQYDRRILLSGGEPFLRDDIIDLIQFIFNNNGEPLVNTNALLIRDTEMDTLARCHAELLVSLDGACAATHEKIRGKGTFQPTLEKIKKLLAHDVITKVSITIHDDNFEELEDFLDLAVELNVAQVAINPLNILSRAEDSKLKRVRLSDFYNTLSELSQKSSRHRYYIERSDFANVGAILLMNLKFQYCGVGAASLVIDYDGSIYPCYNTMQEELLIGNILKDDLDDLWINSPVLKHLRKLNVNSFSEECKNCPVKYYCGGGCRGEAYFANEKLSSKCPYCSDMKASIINMMFLICEKGDSLFQNRIHFFQDRQNLINSKKTGVDIGRLV